MTWFAVYNQNEVDLAYDNFIDIIEQRWHKYSVYKYKYEYNYSGFVLEYNSSTSTTTKYYISVIEQSYERCFPLQKVSRKRFKDKPWITSGLKKFSIIKNKLYKRWILTRLPADEDRYKTYRKLFRKTALDAETKYFKNKFDDKTNSIKKCGAI